MRNRFVAIAISVLAACGVKPNPNVCCATEAQCEALDIHELRPCGPGQACNAGKCEASQCDVSADCPAENPICMDNLCIGSCTTDDQCADTGRPFCDAGVCIACRSPLDCSGDTAICDQQEHACRGCVADDECTSGVCIEFDGTCATAGQLVHVKPIGGTNTGTCTASQPCATLAYALQQVIPTRNVLRVVGSSDGNPSTITITLSYPVIIDGTGNSLAGPANAPLFQINAGVTTIEGFTVASTAQDVVSVSNGATLRMTQTTVNGSAISATGATLELDDVQLQSGSLNQQVLVKCSNGSASISASEFRSASILTSNCALVVQRSLFDASGDRVLDVTGGKSTVENNLLIESQEYADATRLVGTVAGSVIRFNTFVNTSNVNASGLAIDCDGTQEISNNIFAYRSAYPLGPNGGFSCPTHHSLFDSVVVPAQRMGVGNQSTEFPLIFTNPTAKDFHLSASSPAKGIGQPNIVDVDFENKPRPRPIGTNPDVGCYEAP